VKLNKTDLHMHSIYSDGSNTPKELIERSLEQETKTIALTDHDNIEGSKEIIKLNKGRYEIVGRKSCLSNWSCPWYW
jgi:predicted metal-dependent phosphoesterase TrpH